MPISFWAIAAVARHPDGWAIGNAGQLPWHCPIDLSLFRQLTTGCHVVMGRTTWESLNRRPLPKRVCHVLTRNQDIVRDILESGCRPARGLQELKIELEAIPGLTTPVWIAGGAQIYQQSMYDNPNMLDGAVITELDAEQRYADAFFPRIPDHWQVTQEISLENLALNPKFALKENALRENSIRSGVVRQWEKGLASSAFSPLKSVLEG